MFQKLYISDLDGTLLTSSGTLSEHTAAVLQTLMKDGLNFTIASGRTPAATMSLLHKLPLKMPLLLLNGALIYDPVSHKALHTVPLTIDETCFPVSLSALQVGVNDSELVYSITKDHDIWERFIQKNHLEEASKAWRRNHSLQASNTSLLYSIYADHKPEQLQTLYNYLSSQGTYTLDFYKDHYLEDTWFLEVYNNQASKGAALKILRKQSHIDFVVAFGNSENDLSLFAESDWCCAVENALPSLLNEAEQQIMDCDHDGVANYLTEEHKAQMLIHKLQDESSIVSLATSFKKRLRLPYRNAVLLLVDGLGMNILGKHLPHDSFIRTNFKRSLNSVFPPTTAAAATALETGLYPAQSGYLGWSVYWPHLKKNVQLFSNLTDDGMPAAEEHLAKTYLRAPHWSDCSISTKSIPELCSLIQKYTRDDKQNYIYAYINEPDHTLHKQGTESSNIASWLMELDHALEELSKNCPDTLFFLTADHGFIDIDPLCLEDYPELQNMLLVPPSIEPRALNFFVKKEYHKQFCKKLIEITKGTYKIYTKKEVLGLKLFGGEPYHPLYEEMLGDFLAVARTPLTLFPTRTYMNSMVAGHGGLTEEEVSVPLVSWLTSQ